MSQVLRYANARKTGRANLVAGWLAGGSIKCYTADKPSTTDTEVTTQTLLVTFAIPNPAGTVSNGVLTGGVIATAMNAETGTPTWCRIEDSSHVVICDGDVGVTGSNSFVELDNVNLVQGGLTSVTSFSIAEG